MARRIVIDTDPGKDDAVATKGYANGSANYSMTDGSAKSYSWSQVRANDFYKFKVSKPTTAPVTP